MTITLWTIFEILINFYQGGLETWFIYKFLTPRSHERAKIWAVIFAVCEGCLVTAFNYFTVFEGFGSALYWASLLVFAFCFFSDNAVKKFLSISLSQVAILLITSLELNAVSSFFKISLREPYQNSLPAHCCPQARPRGHTAPQSPARLAACVHPSS